MFEVGKKYKGVYDKKIVTCVYINKFSAVLEFENGLLGLCIVNRAVKDNYEEYKEPRVSTVMIHMYETNYGGTYMGKNTSSDYGLKLLGKKEITITEGEGLL